jgi:hypothetical protein
LTVEGQSGKGVGVGAPDLGPRKQTGSWAYAILPYLEQEAVYRQQVWSNTFKLYICPFLEVPQARLQFLINLALR